MSSKPFILPKRPSSFPVSPLLERDHLSERAERALTGIYSIVSLDRHTSESLRDDQLNKFQEYCFGSQLSEEEMKNVKQVVETIVLKD